MDISPVTSDGQDAESGVRRSPRKSVRFLLFIGTILIVNLLGGPEILGILLMPQPNAPSTPKKRQKQLTTPDAPVKPKWLVFSFMYPLKSLVLIP